MLPFYAQPSLPLGPVTLHAFGVAVALAVWMGLALAQRRFRRFGLDAEVGERMAWWALVGGIVGAHLFSVFFYYPDKLAADPWLLLRVWEDISSFGSMLGGLGATVLFLWWRMPGLNAAERWGYLDVVAFVFPFSLALGRVGCALVHDHPGRVTSFPLAVSLESEAARGLIRRAYEGAGRLAELPPPEVLARSGFHDLGLYELLFLAAVVLPALRLLDRRPRPGGFYVVAFAVLYLPVRFSLDFLRVADRQYLGLTPAQWVALAALLALPAVWSGVRARAAAAPDPRTGPAV